MKFLKITGLVVLTIIILVLIAGTFMKKDFHFEKSMEIMAPKDKVWENIVYFRNHEKWSQWKELDPNMKTVITGTDGSVGAKMSWTSDHKEVGNGSQTIAKIDPGKRMDVDLMFEDMGAKSFYAIEGDSMNCKVTWGFDSHVGWPFNAIVSFMMTEAAMDEMFDKGLGMLKKASEE